VRKRRSLRIIAPAIISLLLLSLTCGLDAGVTRATIPTARSGLGVPAAPYALYLPVVLTRYRRLPGPYLDDFSDPLSGWAVHDTEWELTAYVNGEYRFLVKGPGETHWAYWDTPQGAGCCAENYTIEVDARAATDVYCGYGLMFGMPGGVDGYAFVIDTDGWYGIRRRVDWEWQTVVDWAFSGHVSRGLGTNHLRVDRDGGWITAYVNGHQVARVWDDTFVGELGAGLRVSSHAAPADIRFDSFYVSAALPPS
jgi:hypothetical protein